MKALVLSGGSIKGAFQAGAISEVLRSGFRPDIIYGISVGALNAAFLADRAGRAHGGGGAVDWPRIGGDLISFWVDEITAPKRIIKQRGRLSLASQILGNKFNGIVDNAPLRELVRRELSLEAIRGSGLQVGVGAVNLASGECVYAQPGSASFLDFVVASTAIPIIMPLSRINQAPYYDGGVRDIAPLGSVINRGATEIICIVCQPAGVTPRSFNEGSLIALMQRVMDIVANEIVLNDLNHVRFVNDVIRTEGRETPVIALNDYRPINVTLIRPDDELDVQIDAFRSQDIAAMINTGKFIARRDLTYRA